MSAIGRKPALRPADLLARDRIVHDRTNSNSLQACDQVADQVCDQVCDQGSVMEFGITQRCNGTLTEQKRT